MGVVSNPHVRPCSDVMTRIEGNYDGLRGQWDGADGASRGFCGYHDGDEGYNCMEDQADGLDGCATCLQSAESAGWVYDDVSGHWDCDCGSRLGGRPCHMCGMWFCDCGHATLCRGKGA